MSTPRKFDSAMAISSTATKAWGLECSTPCKQWAMPHNDYVMILVAQQSSDCLNLSSLLN
eukprot:3107353-Amphidinium_carterae.1